MEWGCSQKRPRRHWASAEIAAAAVVAAASHLASLTFQHMQRGAPLPFYAPLPPGDAGHAPQLLISLTRTASSADAMSRLHPRPVSG